VEALHQHLWGSHDYALHCPRAAPFARVVSCTYHHWSKPFSRNRRYCQLPVPGGRMQRFVQVRLGSAYCCWPFGRWLACCQGSYNVHTLWWYCCCSPFLEEWYAALFPTNTDTIEVFFAQQGHMQGFGLPLGKSVEGII